MSPTGTIKFYESGPGSAPSSCPSGLTLLGSAVSVTGNTAYNPTAGFTPSTAGDYWLYASYSGDTNNAAAASPCAPTSSQEITVAKGSQSITATVSSSSTPWSNTVTVGSTGSSGTGLITLSLDSGANGKTSDAVCRLNGTTLSATGSGDCYVYASIAADANYTAATSADQEVVFTAAGQSITATVSSSSTPWSNTVTVGSTGSSGTGLITLSLDSGANGKTSDAVCRLNGTTLSATGSGDCYVYASIAADANYTAATSADQEVVFTAAGQSITATVSSSSTPWSNTVTVGSTGSSGTGLITLSLDSGANGKTSDAVCRLNGTTLSATGSGDCYVYASIAADANYTAATSADQEVVFTAAGQSITATVSSSSTPWSNTVTVGSTGSSGTGLITLSLDSGANGKTSDAVCRLNGTTLSATGSGDCYVYASIAADANYTAATSADQEVVFTAAGQSITATVSSSSTPWSNTVTVGSTGSSGTGLITLSLDSGANGKTSDAVCRLNGTTLSATGSGDCYVYASIAADANYTAATSADQEVVFTAAGQSITATVSSSSTPWSNTVTVGSTGSSGTGLITLSLDSGANGKTSDAVCRLNGTTLSATGSGDCYVYASIAADANYTAATSADQEVVFTAAGQSITATVSSSSTPWSNTVTVGSTGSSGTGLITLSLDSGANGKTSDAVCRLNGTTLSATGSGDCYVYASIAADANYTAATSADQEVVFTAAGQSITATVSSSSTPWSNTVTVGSTGSSGTGLITLSLDSGANGKTSDAVCRLNGTTLSATGSGDCYVYASIAADANYTAATSADQEVVFTAAGQSITATTTSVSFSGSATVGSPETVTATVSPTDNGGTVNFSATLGGSPVSLPASCTGASLSSGKATCTFTPTSAGSYAFTATYAGDSNYATSSGTGSVAIGKAATTTSVSFSGSAPVGSPETVTATVSPTDNGGTVNFSATLGGSPVSLPASCTGASLSSGKATCTFTPTSAGSYAFTATYAGDSNYATSSGTGSVAVAKGSQIITFTSSNPSPVTVGDASYTPTATATSGLAVAFTIDASSTPGACSISGGVVSFTGAGTCIVDANQAGNANYFAAPEKQQTITVTSLGKAGPPRRISGKVQPEIYVAAIGPWTLFFHKTVHLKVHLWGRRGTVTGTAKLLLGKKLLCVLELVKGRGRCTLSSSKIGSRRHYLTLKYSGSSEYQAEIHRVNVYVHPYFAAPEKQQTITVTSLGKAGPPRRISGKVQPEIYVAAIGPWTLFFHKTVHLKVHLWGRRGTVTGTAKLLLGKKLLCVLELVKGRGRCTLSSSKIGSRRHYLTLKYSGSSEYQAEIHRVNVYVHP